MLHSLPDPILRAADWGGDIVRTKERAMGGLPPWLGAHGIVLLSGPTRTKKVHVIGVRMPIGAQRGSGNPRPQPSCRARDGRPAHEGVDSE